MVDWNLTGACMKKVKNTQRTNLVKCLHDWQNTGNYNLHFQDREATKADTKKAYKDVHTKCSFNCGAVEIPLHYLYCTINAAKRSKTDLL